MVENGIDVVQKISANIQELTNCVQTFITYVEKIGSAEDTDVIRNSMSELIHQSNSLSKSTGALMKQLVALSNTDRHYRVQRERLMNEYISVLNRLQAAQRRAAVKEKAQIKSVTVEDEMLAAQQVSGATFLDGSEQMRRQIQQQHKINLNEIRERQQTLSQLEADINSVNTIFKDLSRIVHDQGEMVDSIEANIEHASIYVEQGHTNVQQALHYSTKARQKKLFILMFLSALVSIILLFLFLWVR